MKYLCLIAGALLFLVACSHSQPVSDAKPSLTFQEPHQLVQWLYALPNPRFDIFQDKQKRPHYYTKRLIQLTAQRERCYQKEFNMDWLDFDYTVPGNDYDLKHVDVKTLWQEGDMAKVTVVLDNMGEKQAMDYLLRREEKTWRIDDIFYQNHSLSEDLSLGC